MASNDVNVRAVITADDQASKVLKGFGNSLDNAKGASFALLGGLTAMAAGAALTVKAFTESEDVAAQLDAVLRSTAGAAGVTRDSAIALSKSLQATTTFSDEAVLSTENLLLTFTSIGKDIFPQVTETALNMAQALGQDTKSSAIQLGKALQDPILGVTALRRVGVSFNETQLETIKNLVETGHQAEAQKLILAELNKEFGGSATAAAKTFSGQLKQIWNTINDGMEIIGQLIADQIRPLTQAFLDFVNKAGGPEAIIKNFSNTLKDLQDKGYLQAIIGGILFGLVPALWAMAAALAGSLIQLAPFIAAGALLVLAYEKVPLLFWAIVGALGGFAIAMLTTAVPAALSGVAAFGAMAVAVVAATWPFIAIGVVVGGMAYLIVTNWDTVKNAVAVAARAVIGSVNSIMDKFNALPGVIQGAIGAAGSMILNMLGPIGTVIRAVDSLVNSFNRIAGGSASAKGILHDWHIPGFAAGIDNFSGGMAIVGERGPELVSLPRGSSVTPNSQLPSVGGSSVVNISLSGPFMGTPADARDYATLIVNAMKDIAGSKNQSVAEMLG